MIGSNHGEISDRSKSRTPSENRGFFTVFDQIINLENISPCN